MSLLPSFLTWQFALAGAVLALAPIVIHLLNRRRYRIVEWAAMDFLRVAVQRNRRILRVRDLLLLVLRTAVVLLFGLALAQPYFKSSSDEFRGDQPIHAIVVVDNSLSMGYQRSDGTLLQIAKEQVRRLLEQLPAGSQISLVPTCGSRQPFSIDPYRDRDQALESLDRIEISDRTLSLPIVFQDIRRIAELSPELSKQVILFSDQQRLNWLGANSTFDTSNLPTVQIVDVGLSVQTLDWQNSWVADLRLQDGLADCESPATIVAELRHCGSRPRENVVVTLQVNGLDVGSTVVTLDSSEAARQVVFQHQFELPPGSPGRPQFVPVSVRLAPDRLAADDERHLMAAVAARLPAVFVDQVPASEENPIRNQLGETRPLRVLLSPNVRGSMKTAGQLISIRHLTIGELNRETLREARLLVIAGIRNPGDRVPIVREFIEQGGQVLIAAGAEFHPEEWTKAAWQDGNGILPAPLAFELLGELPDSARDEIKPFFLFTDKLAAHDLFQIAGLSETELRDLYSEPIFFQAIVPDLSATALERFLTSERDRLSQRSTQATATQATATQATATQATATQATATPETANQERTVHNDQLLERASPQILARFDNNRESPFLVERRIGAGRVMLLTTGLQSNWSTLANSNAVVLLDRIMRSLILETLPQRNFETLDAVQIPAGELDFRSKPSAPALMLQRPGSENWESLEFAFMDRQTKGVAIEQPVQRGIYRLAKFDSDSSASTTQLATPSWEIRLALNGPSGESDLTPMNLGQGSRDQLPANITRVQSAESVDLSGVQVRGREAWWWLALLVFGLLIAELLTLAMTNRQLFALPPTAPST